MVEVVKRIENDLKEFALVLFIESGKEFAEEWLGCVIKLLRLKDTTKKIMILSDIDISFGNFYNYAYYKVNRNEKEALERLYFMYDFSNRFFMISDRQQYGSLNNYIRTGVITMEEIIQILLCGERNK